MRGRILNMRSERVILTFSLWTMCLSSVIAQAPDAMASPQWPFAFHCAHNLQAELCGLYFAVKEALVYV